MWLKSISCKKDGLSGYQGDTASELCFLFQRWVAVSSFALFPWQWAINHLHFASLHFISFHVNAISSHPSQLVSAETRLFLLNTLTPPVSSFQDPELEPESTMTQPRPAQFAIDLTHGVAPFTTMDYHIKVFSYFLAFYRFQSATTASPDDRLKCSNTATTVRVTLLFFAGFDLAQKLTLSWDLVGRSSSRHFG